MEFSQANYLRKARMRPDLMRKVLYRLRNEGLLDTYKVVRNLIDQPIALGYSCAGIVEAVGEKVRDLRTGQRVACAGVFKATHSEYVAVPRNLVVPVPGDLPLEQACFVALGAIAMQGVRMAGLELGETVAVYGVGLVGLLSAQLALAAGCRVIGLDIDPAKAALVDQYGGVGLPVDKEMPARVMELTEGYGVDKVLLCAATKSKRQVETIPEIIRQKGVLTVVGLVSLDIPERDYQMKEIDIRFCRSYGPGRYDITYEEDGIDYPYPYVRWTENRNMAAFLDLALRERLKVGDLITHRYPIEQALEAYELISGKSDEPYLGIVISYGSEEEAAPFQPRVDLAPAPAREGVGLGLVGAGNFAKAILLPAFAAQRQARLISVCSASGVSAATVARKYGAARATSRVEDILEDPQVDTVIIATRHDTHATYVLEALRAGKAVFVEKPLAINMKELEEIDRVYRSRQEAGKAPFLMVGYNRRFSPLAGVIRDVFAKVKQPLCMVYRVNAGPPPSEWVTDPIQGGGRVVGEVCHFIDLMTYICGSLPVAVSASSARKEGRAAEDMACFSVEFANGSLGSVHYISTGHPSLPKEFLEVFGGGMTAQLHNFTKVKLFGAKAKGRTSYANQVKGFPQEAAAVVQSRLEGGLAPISYPEIFAVAKATILAAQALGGGGKTVLD